MIEEGNCIRLYGQNGRHMLSLLPCGKDGIDIATPDGEVLYCDQEGDLKDIVTLLLPLVRPVSPRMPRI